MVKKRGRSARGQITVFMILGLVLLFIAMFMLNLSYQAKKGEITGKQAEIVAQLFQKEGLRLYIQDCLADPVREGLDLIGKQGTIWQDQGGRIEFDPPRNGLLIPGEDAETGGRVFFGIANKDYAGEDFAFPCSTGENSPEYCQYIFPATAKFGKREALSLNTLKTDLKSYIAKETTSCIDDFAKIENLPVPELQPVDLEKGLEVTLNDDLIAVRISSPVAVKSGDVELFSLSSFDAIYPTNFVKFFRTYIDLLVRYDVQYLDFEFGPDAATINQKRFKVGRKNFIANSGCVEVVDGTKKYFKCDVLAGKYAGTLQPELVVEDVNNGDELFTISSGEHELRFLRQNRPPVLDYVNRSACPAAGYDYLVVPGAENVSNLEFDLFAKDPDEDKDVVFGFNYDSLGLTASVEDSTTGVLKFDSLPAPKEEPYEVFVEATDEHGLVDGQTIRVLVDRPLEMDLALELPYDDVVMEQGGAVYVSNEDPVFLKIKWPLDSNIKNKDPALFQSEVTLDYSNDEENEVIAVTLPLDPSVSEDCKSFPWTNSHPNCDLADYENDIDKWKLSDSLGENHFAAETNTGNLELSFNMNYCSTFNAGKDLSTPVIVKGCIPHKNSEYPFAYPYHMYKYSSYDFENGVGVFVGKDSGSNVINPLNSTHSCCLGDPLLPGTWKVAPDTEVCFTDPEPKCAAKIDDYTAGPGFTQNKGYIFEQQRTFCDGVRGNSCKDGITEGEKYQGELRCGDRSLDVQCNKVHTDCQNVLSWGYVENTDGDNIAWCHGQMGCDDVCSKEVVDISSEKRSQLGSFAGVNTWANEDPLLPDTDSDVSFVCGCSNGDDGDPCDENYDGKFDGVCQAGECTEI